jgi:hypothetical protein
MLQGVELIWIRWRCLLCDASGGIVAYSVVQVVKFAHKYRLELICFCKN